MNDFAKKVKDILYDGTSEVKPHIIRINILENQINSGEYSISHIKEKLYPERDQHRKDIAEIKRATRDRVYGLVDEARRHEVNKSALNWESVPSDIEFLRLDFLPGEAILELAQKHAENPVMMRLLRDYAKKNDLKTRHGVSDVSVADLLTERGQDAYDPYLYVADLYTSHHIDTDSALKTLDDMFAKAD